MPQRKSKRKPPSEQQMKKRNKVIFRVAVICMAFYGVVSVVQLQTQIENKQDEVNSMQYQIQQQKEVNEALRKQVEEGLTDEQIAAMAREQGYVMPSERVFADASSK